MASSHRNSQFFPPLISIVIVFVILESTPTTVDARELRPSNHGLEYYYEPSESSDMTSFFGPPSSNELTSSTSSTSSSPSVSTLPSAVKSPMTSSSSKARDDDDDDDDDHVMSHVLVVGSLVCGLSGVVLMVASALIYFLGYPKIQNSSNNSDQIHNNAK